MDLIEIIEEKLQKYPNLEKELDESGISVTPEGGFTVWAKVNGSSYTVGFEGWHEEFEDMNEAINCFAWGLSKECRLQVTSRGGVAHKWVVQSLEGGQWINSSATGLLLFPFWRRAEINHKQNAVINS